MDQSTPLLPGSSEMARRICDHDWASTSLGPISLWGSELKSAVVLVLDFASPAALIWGPEHVTLYNDRFSAIIGDKPNMLGRSFADVWSEAWSETAPIVERAYRGEANAIEDLALNINRSGQIEQAFFTFACSPVRSADGTVLGMIDMVADTTMSVRSRVELRESEERFRALATAGTYMTYRMSPDWRLMYNLRGRDFLADTSEPVENWAENYLLPEDRPAIFAVIEKAIHTKSLFELEHRVRMADGGVGWVISRAVPILGPKGEIVGWFGAGSDVTERREANERLRASEAALRQVEGQQRALIEAIPQLVWRAVDAGHWTWAGAQWEAFTGQSGEQSHGWGWLEQVHEDDREAARAAWRKAEKNGRFEVEYRIRQKDGGYRWFQTRATPVRSGDDDQIEWFGTSTDVDDVRQLREHERVLLLELQHRVRNSLSVIRSLVRRTGVTSETLEDYTAHLEGRINAFARVQSAVARDPGQGVSLGSIVAEELLGVGAQEGREARIDGPLLRLKPKAAENLGLAIHELATNAMKYGALTMPRGQIHVEWQIARGDMLRFKWQESGMHDLPAVPRRQGFGSELLTRTLTYELEAEARLVFEPRGLSYTVSIPLSELIVDQGPLASQ